jgi:hypothetical protein
MIRALRILWFTALFVTIATLVIHCGAPTPPPPPPTTTSTTPGPSPTPTATPTPPDTCRFTLADVASFRSVIKPNGGGQALDLTVVAVGKNRAPCNHPTGSGLACELSAEKGNQNCAWILYGIPWWTPDPTVKLGALQPGVPAQGNTQKISAGDGLVSICGSTAMATRPGACIRLHVKAAAPACDVDAAGHCVLQ